MNRLLSEIPKDEVVEVISIESSPLRSKLMELGIIQGKEIKVLFHAPFGDPIAVKIGGFVLSLRKSEAALITVQGGSLK